ncbi:MAG: phytanoyl-CoA dioxygenase family protein [Phycisphaeraceae bacterium]|nr:phytanoyl-CoA dioxygenase family protein [Phycisphaeraceae bacterium]
MTVALEPVVRPLQLSPSEVQFYKNEGYLYIGGLIGSEDAAALREEVIEVVCVAHGITRQQLANASGTADKLRQSAQFLEGSKLQSLIQGSEILEVASQLLEGQAIMYSPFTAIKAGGGGGTFHFHQDNNYTEHVPGSSSLNIWVALNDMSPENGCLQIVPRSHLKGQLKSRTSDDGDAHQQVEVDPMTCLPLRMRAGDAVAFTRWTVHGSGPNDTSEPRVAYAMQCHRPDTLYVDKQTGEKKNLAENPLWKVEPVAKLTQTGK